MHLVLYYRTRNTGLTQPYSSSSMSCRILPMLYKPCPLPGLESFQSTNAKDVVSRSARLYWWIHACDPCWNKLIVQWCKYCDRETLFERLCCTSSLATLYSLLFVACNGCIFMPSRTIVREIWFELEDSFFAAEMRRSTRVMVR